MSHDSNRSKAARRKMRGGKNSNATNTNNQTRANQPHTGGSTGKLAAAKRHYERYISLARDAASTGDPIEAENLFQHAEHYFRTMREHGNGGQDEAAAPRKGLPTS